MPDTEITIGARYVLPSGRHVRVVSPSPSGNAVVCEYVTPFSETSYRDAESGVTLTGLFLHLHARPVARTGP